MDTNVIAIGIISCDRGSLTQRCLNSVRACTQTPYRIYLVDNGSTDDATRRMLDEWERCPDVTLFRLPENRGPSAGRNVILRDALARHQLFAMLDNDIVVLEGWDRAARSAIADGFDAVQPKLLKKGGTIVDRGPTAPPPEPWKVYPVWIGINSPRDAPDVSRRRTNATFATGPIVSAEIYRRVGLYDERLWVAEDFELGFRATAEGFRIGYEPECEMIHDHESDLAYEIRRTDLKTRLIAHLVIWENYQRLLLPPDALFFYSHLIRRNEPLFLTDIPKWSPRGILRRIQRRCVTRYFHMRYGDHWRSMHAGGIATERLTERMAPLFR
jgi:GT2 family glycosyltransferase